MAVRSSTPLSREKRNKSSTGKKRGPKPDQQKEMSLGKKSSAQEKYIRNANRCKTSGKKRGPMSDRQRENIRNAMMGRNRMQ